MSNAFQKPLTRLAAGAVLLGTAALAGAEDAVEAKEGMVYIDMHTSMGNIVLELDPEKAPVSVENFLGYVEDEFYDGTVFHRIIPSFMIQGGGFSPEMEKKPTRDAIINEWENGLKNVRGSIAMARVGNRPNPKFTPGGSEPQFLITPTTTSQFFINVVDNPFLDTPRDGEAYAVFGSVIAGMEAVDMIKAVPTTRTAQGMQNVPETPVMIKQVRQIEADQLDAAVKGVEASLVDARAAAAKAEEERAAKRGDDFKNWRDNLASQMAAEIDGMKTKLDGEATDIQKLLDDYGVKYEDAKVSSTGLRYFDITEGEGATPGLDQGFVAHYTGWTIDGKKFDSSRDRGSPLRYGTTQVIKGWTEALCSMQIGGKRLVVIPYQLGYGERGNGPIPAEATLIFEMELLGVQ